MMKQQIGLSADDLQVLLAKNGSVAQRAKNQKRRPKTGIVRKKEVEPQQGDRVDAEVEIRKCSSEKEILPRPKTALGVPREALARQFLKRPSPQKELLVKERTTDLYTHYVLAQQRIKQLEQKLMSIHAQNGGATMKPRSNREESTHFNERGVGNMRSEEHDVERRILELTRILEHSMRRDGFNGSTDLSQENMILKAKSIKLVRSCQQSMKQLKEEQEIVRCEKKKMKNMELNLQLLDQAREEIRSLKAFIKELDDQNQKQQHIIEAQDRAMTTLNEKQCKIDDVLSEVKAHGKDNAFKKAFLTLSGEYVSSRKDMKEMLAELEKTKTLLEDERKRFMQLERQVRTNRSSTYRRSVLSSRLILQGLKFDGESGGDTDGNHETQMMEEQKKFLRSNPRRSSALGKLLLGVDDENANNNSSTNSNCEVNDDDDTAAISKPAISTVDEGTKPRKLDWLPEVPDLHSMESFAHILKKTEVEEDYLKNSNKAAKNTKKVPETNNDDEEGEEMDRLLRQLGQMRLLLETLKYLYLNDNMNMLLVSGSFRHGDSDRFAAALMGSEDQLIHMMSRHGPSCVGSESMRLFVFNEEKNQLWGKRLNSFVTISLEAHREIVPGEPLENLSDRDLVVCCFRSEEVIHVETADADPETSMLKSNVICAPVKDSSTDKVIGVIIAENKKSFTGQSIIQGKSPSNNIAARKLRKNQKPQMFTEFDEFILVVLAGHVGCILKNIFFEKSRILKNRYDGAILKLNQTIGTPNDVMDFAQKVEKMSMDVICGTKARAFLVDFGAAQKVMWYRKRKEGNGMEWEKSAPFSLAECSSIAARVIHDGKAMVSKDVHRHEAFNSNIDLRYEVYSGGPMVCAPIQVPVGTSFLGSLQEDQCSEFITLGCVQVSFGIQGNTSQRIDTLTEAGTLLGNILSVIAPQLDHLWKCQLSFLKDSGENDLVRQNKQHQEDLKVKDLRIQALEAKNKEQQQKLDELNNKLRVLHTAKRVSMSHANNHHSQGGIPPPPRATTGPPPTNKNSSKNKSLPPPPKRT